ncbi:MAG: class I SAM-dependent methyltransferase [Candidatus Eremiobacteraeota bacterium]|nr:class I SAM-dependent methyltransferase [Candidatus Eremiobacteraeota bacterium]
MVSLSNQDVLKWDVDNWSVALAYWQRYGKLEGAPLECLEIGANQGGLSVWLASKGHRVVCSDLERTDASARPLVTRYGVLDRVTFEDINATAIPYENHFDVIVFKSVLGGVGHNRAIERQRAAIASMHRALKPGGEAQVVVPFCHPYHAYPADYSRFSREQLQALFSDFRDVKIGIRTGPTTTMLTFVTYYLKLILPVHGGNRLRRAANRLLVGAAGWMMFPLKYLDAWMNHLPDAHVLANHLYVSARK